MFQNKCEVPRLLHSLPSSWTRPNWSQAQEIRQRQGKFTGAAAHGKWKGKQPKPAPSYQARASLQLQIQKGTCSHCIKKKGQPKDQLQVSNYCNNKQDWIVAIQIKQKSADDMATANIISTVIFQLCPVLKMTLWKASSA